MGNRRENKAVGAAKFNTDPVERKQKKPGSFEQNQDGGASQKPSKERISGRREWLAKPRAAEISRSSRRKCRGLCDS